jgi:hypothetical protein
MGALSSDRLTCLCLASITSLTLAGCRSAPPGPVVGYTGTILKSSAVAGRPGAFRLLVRIRSKSGQAVPLPPELWITDPGAGTAPSLTWTARRLSAFNRPYCDLLVQGSVGRPLTAPTTITVDMQQSRGLPAWRRLMQSGSTRSYSEVSARTRLGTLVLKPGASGGA